MSLQRWWSVILTMGLFMALSPLSAQAGPNRTFAPQPNRQAFTAPQPRAFAPQVNRQAFTAPQPCASANGWNSQPRQWQPPRGNTYGWNGQNRQWNQPHNNANGWNGQHRQWNQHPAMPMDGMINTVSGNSPEQRLRTEWPPASVEPAEKCLRRK